ncbi:hypothetical protein L798_04770 [Zootermopsis nevadensis]|uniref:Uncharacterized protein n=1 Tax=Zootermopsis nevadensis TaxID=136037 RepID=A0A067R9V7_ZOONE|nr:hypothetical protein L798_04770 [Zootermopsis nevadensis]
MQHVKCAAEEEEEEVALHGRPILRQYRNKRTRNEHCEIYTPAAHTDKKEAQSSIFHVLPAHFKDSCSVLPLEPIQLKSSPDSEPSTSEPQVIVRKFTLPPFRSAYALPELLTSEPQVIVRKFTLPSLSGAYALPKRSKKDVNFGKPKQRWKQLCNLQHEMTTTLPVRSVVKMMGPSTPLTQEYCPGTLQSCAAGKLDVVNSSLQKWLTVKEVNLDSSNPSKDEGSVSSASSVKMKTVTPPKGALGSKIEVGVEERLGTAEDVPEVAAVTEVSSTGGTVTVGAIDAVHSNVGIVGGKFLIFQPLSQTKPVVQQEGSNSKANTIVLKSPQDVIKDAKNAKNVIKPFVGQAEVMSDSLKTVLVQGSVKPSFELSRKQRGIVQENLKPNSEPTTREQNVVWGSLKHKSSSNIKERNVVRGNSKHRSEVPKNGENDNLKIDAEPALEENATHDHDISRGNLKTISECASKEQNIVAVHPIPQETNNLGVARESLQDALTFSLQTTGIVAPQQTSAQNKNSECVEPPDKPAEDENVELKQLKQLQHEILMMKRRQNIAMQVDRKVLRAKDVKLVQEFHLPARRVLLSETGTQTNLFCLVEPGRMVEMMISADKTGEYCL